MFPSLESSWRRPNPKQTKGKGETTTLNTPRPLHSFSSRYERETVNVFACVDDESQRVVRVSVCAHSVDRVICLVLILFGGVLVIHPYLSTQPSQQHQHHYLHCERIYIYISLAIIFYFLS